jgi:hypothetical protein
MLDATGRIQKFAFNPRSALLYKTSEYKFLEEVATMIEL